MHDVGKILSSAFRGSLDELREQYLHLSGLESQERDRVVAEANSALAATQSKISHSDTLRAKDVLLAYQYATRFVYDVESQSKRHFVEVLARLWRGNEADILSWSWQPPSKSEFFRSVQERLPSVDFYTQVNILCDELFGVPMPSASDSSLRDWSDRAKLTEPGWSWRYENQLKEEQARWFSSQKRIGVIEAQWGEHKAKAARCIDEIAPLFAELHPAKSRLQELKGEELWLSGHCFAINRAAEALGQGVQLKHLLLEEAHDMGNVFRAATRGL